jgi:hypothetical protein
MGRGLSSAAAFIALAALAGAAPAEQARESRPDLFKKLIDCRAITESAARLACFDERVAALDAAEAKQDVVVVDRGQIRKARRSLFGLTLPRLGIFGGGKEEEAEEEGFSQIDSTIQSARRNREGKWVLILEDGARWVQVDNRSLLPDPAAGQPIRIRRAALGSSLANVGKQTAIRMRREN